jgi:hypothetical protein
MSKLLLREYYELCPGGICDDLLTESEKRFVANGGLILSGKLQEADARNGNGRIYPYRILAREMNKYKQVIKERRALGELDHPEDSVVNLRNASHIVTDVWWSGKDVMGKCQVLNTPSGNILKALVESGVKLGISSRGLGSVRESNGNTIVEDDFSLVCFDFVSDPSTTGAFMMKESKGSQKDEIQRLNEKLDRLLGALGNESSPDRISKINKLLNRLTKGE